VPIKKAAPMKNKGSTSSSTAFLHSSAAPDPAPLPSSTPALAPLNSTGSSSYIPPFVQTFSTPPEVPSSGANMNLFDANSATVLFSTGDFYRCKEQAFKPTVSSETAMENQNKNQAIREASKRDALLEKCRKQAELLQCMKKKQEQQDLQADS
jgi:hypothetical protein